ncbi:MAG: TRAP transporter small permease [Variovorax paradoxus]|uniref:TRAP transporter small permease protein n=1 Tax=Variovorax paradoxus TaxID=34073 RepID=A0A2W5RVX3_VARPD|nr:MAG: TRAP transporter small permease [Variovorax paradoxus]
MVAMVVMVFGNVVLRYGFNSGITVSDEMSRGVDTLIKHLPRAGKKACFFINQVLMLFCNVLFFMGTYEMHELQTTNISPVVGISMIWIYGIGYVVSVVMGLINLEKLWRLFTGRMSDDELVQVMESEDVAPEPGHADEARSAS